MAVDSGADPEGGTRPPLFAPISLKSPLSLQKKSCGRAPEPPAPLLFQNPGSAPETNNIGIQMNPEELTKTFMMISN